MRLPRTVIGPRLRSSNHWDYCFFYSFVSLILFSLLFFYQRLYYYHRAELEGGGTQVSGSASAISFWAARVFFFLFLLLLLLLLLVEGGGPLRTSSTWRVCSAALAEASSNSRGNHRTGPKGPSYRQLFAILGTKWTCTLLFLSRIYLTTVGSSQGPLSQFIIKFHFSSLLNFLK
jgi:hypothetical protein